MKTVCSFCKTEYSLNSAPAQPVQCAVCGHIWNVPVPRRKNSLLVFIAALSALMAASVFTIVIITKQHADNIKKNPLTTGISTITKTTDEMGVQHFVVNGFITNKTQNIYGVPDIVIVARDDQGNIIARQKFFAPVTLLESGKIAPFSHTLSVPTDDVRKITVELKK
jgi:hypothetical protein